MRTERTDTGWADITTKKFVVEKISFNFIPRKDFLDFNEKYPKIGRRRKVCKCCKTDFKKVYGDAISLAVTNKGNQVICLPCAVRLIELGIPHFGELINQHVDGDKNFNGRTGLWYHFDEDKIDFSCYYKEGMYHGLMVDYTDDKVIDSYYYKNDNLFGSNISGW